MRTRSSTPSCITHIGPRGKGSHGLLTLGDLRTVVRNPKGEQKTGTYHAMLKQPGLTERDLF